MRDWLLASLYVAAVAATTAADDRLSVLFLGDQGHHRPAAMHELAAQALGKEAIDLTYTGDVATLTAERLAKYDALLIFRDSGDLPAENEAALLSFVEAGKGLVAVHCASHCFRNSTKYTALVGGRFSHHDSGTFRAKIVDAQHPALRGVESFESWDETYVHNELTDDRRLLMVREQEGGYEPYTWAREQGQGRVYYTALGHDERTWRNPAFAKLLAAALRWTAGRVKDDLPPVEYVDAGDGLPNYIAGKKWGTEGDRLKRMPRPLAPSESLRQMHTPEGFDVELFAAEPDIAKPIAMSFDERGRLWVIESVDYPNTLRDDPHENGEDRIKICEDTDGDGRADKFTIFADRLNVPTSVLPVRNGAIVAVAPHLAYLEDTDQDGKADRRTILFTGFGRRDTHAVTSNLHYGLDNWIYAAVGYSGGTVKTGDIAHSFKQGIYRFRPDGSAFEVLTSTSNNTWGLGLSESGEIFASTANNEHSVFLAIPNRYFEMVRGWHGAGSAGIEDHKHYDPIAADVRQMDWHGAFTAATGHELYTARAFPREYWNRAALVCEPTGHLVHLDWLVPRGSSYVARDGYNLLASTDPWSAPIAAQVGPDGAVWALDWYNYVVQHNPTPQGFETGPGNAYETPLRDRTHGRVYRVVARDASASAAPHLDRNDPTQLVAALGHDNLFWRLQAQRLLVERGLADVVPQLVNLVGAAEQAPAVLHALWTLAGLRDGGAIAREPDPFSQLGLIALKSADSAVRRAALKLLPRTGDSGAAILAAGCLRDASPGVRLDALLALSEMPASAATAGALVEFLSSPDVAQDRWLPLAATCAAARNDAPFLDAIATFNGAPPAPLLTAARVVAEHFARGKPGDAVAPLLARLPEADVAISTALIGGLAAGWPEGAPPTIGKPLEEALAATLRALPGSAGLPVITLANRWGAGDSLAAVADEMKTALLREAADAALADEARRQAVVGLLALDPAAKNAAQIIALITPRTSPELAADLLDALGQSTAAEVGATITAGWSQYTPATQAKAAAVLLRRSEWTKALLDGIENESVALANLSVETEQRLAQHPDSNLRERAAKLLAGRGRLADPDRQKVFDALRPLADRRGDAVAGKVVFEKNCAKCHRHSGEGGNVGPDLTGMAARKRADILSDVLDPNRSVEGNFQQYTVTTTDGRILSGLLAAETRTTIELVDAEARKQIILREDIDELAGSKRSLMPEGFEKLPADELVNLLEFLAARGRYFPLPLDKAATAVSTIGMFYDHAATAERLIFADWKPRTLCGVPFYPIDPRDDRVPNVVLLYGPQGAFPPQMPKSVSVPCNATVKAIHLLSGVSGWGYPLGMKGSLTMTVRLVYADGESEDHPLLNGEHFADYIRRVDVPGSKFAAHLRDQQIRVITIEPARHSAIDHVELIKGDDATAPVVMAMTAEAGE
ncbi:MAG TPA: PVC-type heme-binding CxxCH protein [Pirellulales bacterium]|nr:PVC-type heme-binding CxxCH protein [Pirellulales bacterium]